MADPGPLRRVLVAEDDPDIRDVLRLALERFGGLEVHLVDDGARVLEELRVVSPDLVILDVMMPSMDGPSAAAAIHSLGRHPETPVVFLTARAREEDIQHLLTIGAIGVIRKPFDPLTLAEQVRCLWTAHQHRAGEREGL